MRSLRPYVFYGFFRSVCFAVAYLPVKLTWRVFVALASWASRRDNTQVATVRNNMAMISSRTGESLDELVGQAFVSYAMYWYELFRSTRATTGAIASRVSAENVEVLDKAFASGEGVILALPHVGNWEHAGAWISDRGIPITVVAERLRPPALFAWFTKTRERHGVEVLPLDQGTSTKLLSLLDDGGVVGLLCDRDISSSGIEVDFFGKKANIPGGPALLAIRTGAVVIPVATHLRPDHGVHIVFKDPMRITKSGSMKTSITEGTQAIIDQLEPLIAAHPEQWHMFQPVWASDAGAK